MQRHFERAPSRRGFTLVELLVVIAIIAILVAMLLPAINAVRQQALRLSCLNNLGQLALAMHNYEMHNGHYPSGTVNASGPIVNESNGYHHSWTVALLPFLEEFNFHAGVDTKLPVYDPHHIPIASVTPQSYTCASSPYTNGYGSYAAVYHHEESPIDSDNSGVFYLNSRTRVRDIKDGASYTLFVGDVRLDGLFNGGWMSGTRSTLRNTATPPGDTHLEMVKHGLDSSSRSYWGSQSTNTPWWETGSAGYGEQGVESVELFEEDEPRPNGDAFDNASSEMEGDENLGNAANGDAPDEDSNGAFDAADATDEPPPADDYPEGMLFIDEFGNISEHSENKPPVKLGPKQVDPQDFIGGFGSYHLGNGANMAFGDGRATYIMPNVDPVVFQQMGHRADGRPLVTEDY